MRTSTGSVTQPYHQRATRCIQTAFYTELSAMQNPYRQVQASRELTGTNWRLTCRAPQDSFCSHALVLDLYITIQYMYTTHSARLKQQDWTAAVQAFLFYKNQ